MIKNTLNSEDFEALMGVTHRDIYTHTYVRMYVAEWLGA